ncbi:hypothetical protein ABH37_06295 [Mycobacterium haemophilum]|uniref:Uncharacterized protein n=1 Tax=Mycobacterium haemophilum TaxID=29311 RepID=A0A0I9UMM7_9MYCO|nr:hypothetical protein ABH39_14305 [Mycobacterium haemophilum]KLO37467.1 hypothetical protein ABH38_08770 [Mycobacterium haemophilum]KLO44016.1 hypothetical protein ABH37_06295 [Mycobacterium haemophilum]KLO49296.1 hypothetical protein ABH36_13160 [Mycobacterium haemophilum]
MRGFSQNTNRPRAIHARTISWWVSSAVATTTASTSALFTQSRGSWKTAAVGTAAAARSANGI